MTQQNKRMNEDNPLYTLRTKHQRAERQDVDSLRKDTEKHIAATYKPRDRTPINMPIKHGEDRSLEILAEVWEFVAENIERDEWKAYTCEDWAELERYHVERAEYTEPDLFDDIMTAYERGEVTEAEAQAWAKRYRKCEYRFCEDVFKPSRSNQWYCNAGCRSREANALQRYKTTGTYLPPHVYKDNRDDTNQRNYEAHERSFMLEELTDVVIPGNHKNTYGGKRNQAWEYDRELIYDKMFVKDEEYEAETLSKQHYKHVNSDGKNEGNDIQEPVFMA